MASLTIEDLAKAISLHDRTDGLLKSWRKALPSKNPVIRFLIGKEWVRINHTGRRLRIEAEARPNGNLFGTIYIHNNYSGGFSEECLPLHLRKIVPNAIASSHKIDYEGHGDAFRAVVDSQANTDSLREGMSRVVRATNEYHERVGSFVKIEAEKFMNHTDHDIPF